MTPRRSAARRTRQARDLVEAARDERGAAVGAKAQPVGDAAGDGQHVLQRAPQLHALHVRGAVAPEARRGQQLLRVGRRAGEGRGCEGGRAGTRRRRSRWGRQARRCALAPPAPTPRGRPPPGPAHLHPLGHLAALGGQPHLHPSQPKPGGAATPPAQPTRLATSSLSAATVTAVGFWRPTSAANEGPLRYASLPAGAAAGARGCACGER